MMRSKSLLTIAVRVCWRDRGTYRTKSWRAGNVTSQVNLVYHFLHFATFCRSNKGLAGDGIAVWVGSEIAFQTLHYHEWKVAHGGTLLEREMISRLTMIATNENGWVAQLHAGDKQNYNSKAQLTEFILQIGGQSLEKSHCILHVRKWMIFSTVIQPF